MKIHDIPLVTPEEDEVRLAVKAIGLNRAEISFRKGNYLESPKFPSRLGYEAAGVVDAIGSGVSGIKIGDLVSTIPAFSMGKYGVYGESAIVPATAVAKYPESLSATEGAALWMQYLTAFGALIHHGDLKPHHRVLITAASSSVGLAAIQIAKWAGAMVIAVTRSNEKVEFLQKNGADHVVATDNEGLPDRIMEITSGQGVNLVFDPIGGPLLSQLAEVAAKQAMIIEYGTLSTSPTPFPLFGALGKGLVIRGYTLFEITQDPEKLARAKQFVYRGVESGRLRPIIDKTFPLGQIQEAHQYMESNQQKGKIIVLV